MVIWGYHLVIKGANCRFVAAYGQSPCSTFALLRKQIAITARNWLREVTPPHYERKQKGDMGGAKVIDIGIKNK
jgi:hypothetical protein